MEFRFPKGKNLYILAQVYNEGFESADSLYWAKNELEVVSHILSRARKYIEGGKKGDSMDYQVLRSLGPSNLLGDDLVNEIYRSFRGEIVGEVTRLTDQFLLSVSPKEMLEIMNVSSPNGDSTAEVSVTEVRPEDFIDLMNPHGLPNIEFEKDPHLFILSQTYDDGFQRGGLEGVFIAGDVLDVSGYILNLIEDYVVSGKPQQGKSTGERFYRIIQSMLEQPRDEEILEMGADALLSYIDDSYVDGDSFAKVSISEYDPSDIIDLDMMPSMKYDKYNPKIKSNYRGGFYILFNVGKREIRGEVYSDSFVPGNPTKSNVSTSSWAETSPEIAKEIGNAYIALAELLLEIEKTFPELPEHFKKYL